MTASIQNSNSSFFILERALSELLELDGMTPEEKLWHIDHCLDSFVKCLTSMSSQIRLYESAKNTTRALIVEHEDGSDEVVSGLSVKALRLPLPNLQQDAVVYGKEETLKALANALGQMNWPSEGPATLNELAIALAEKANPPEEVHKT